MKGDQDFLSINFVVHLFPVFSLIKSVIFERFNFPPQKEKCIEKKYWITGHSCLDRRWHHKAFVLRALKWLATVLICYTIDQSSKIHKIFKYLLWITKISNDQVCSRNKSWKFAFIRTIVWYFISFRSKVRFIIVFISLCWASQYNIVEMASPMTL